MTNGIQSIAVYTETYDDAVYFDLTMAEASLIRSYPGGMPPSVELCGRVLADAAFAIHAKNAGYQLVFDTEPVLAIPRGLRGFGVGGDEDTCSVVVFEKPLVSQCAELKNEGHRPAV